MQVLIKKYRQQKGLSLRRLQELTGISKSQLSNIENKTAEEYLKKLSKIAKHLDVCTKSLFVNCCDVKKEGCDYDCERCCTHRHKNFIKRRE